MDPAIWPNHLLKADIEDYILTYEFWGNTNIQSIAGVLREGAQLDLTTAFF